MSSRLIRVLFVVIAIAIGVTAGYFLKTADSQLKTGRTASNVLRERATALVGTLSDVRASQAAYVARGQGEDFWMSRVSTLRPTLDRQAAEFTATLTSPDAQAAFEPAAAALETFQKLDARAQDYVKSGDSLLASDLIFSDGIESLATAATQVNAAMSAELQAREAGFQTLGTRELTILGGGAGAMLLIVMLLGFTGAAPKSVEPDVQEPVRPMPHLKDAARLCSDLARVQEASQLPSLLERAAKVIDASGIVVWIADPSGQALRPATSFGYSGHEIARMGSIPREATNAVAAAYRSAELRTVDGALVAPLMASDGCLGVLSAEMKTGSEKGEDSQALIAIFAAQLATLVSPPPATDLTTAAQA